MTKKVRLTINEIPITVDEGTTILDAAKSLDISIPTLCYFDLKEFNIENRVGGCRLCVVDVEGRGNLAPSCSTPVTEGMKVTTNNPRVLYARRTVLQLLLSDHPQDCLVCTKSGTCELQKLASDFGVRQIRFKGEMSDYPIDNASKAIHREPNKCVLCRRCETACNVMQTVGTLSNTERGFKCVVDTAGHIPLTESSCTFCGQCVAVCPTGALTSINFNAAILKALYDPTKIVVAQTAPAVRVAIGELFGLEPGSVSTGKLVSALKKLHFDQVFDTNFAADLTIMEEAHELVERLKNGGPLPLLTSCCPGWVNFLEHQFPELIYIPSSAKSPQQMMGAVIKHYWGQKMGKRPEDIVVVSIMPCLAKKHEAAREEMKSDGVPDVDYVMTTKELGALLKESGINLSNLKDVEYDNPLGESSGAADIFASAGGVLEAALRTACEWATGQPLKNINFTDVRGIDGAKVAEIDVGGSKLRVAQASGLGNARRLLEKVQKNEEVFHAIEIMACPGGCLNGGGQPHAQGRPEILEQRMKAIYSIDASKEIRQSHLNPAIQKIYKEFFVKPGSEVAHKFLHTKYYDRSDKLKP